MGIFPIAAAALCLLVLDGCSGCRAVPEELPLKFEAEHLSEQGEMKITREDLFPWHRVEFRLNKEYIYTAELVKDPVIMVAYSRFYHERTGEVYDPRQREPFRIHITAAEGYGHLP